MELNQDDVSVVHLTTDAWTSLANQDYIAVTAHFLDADFVLHTRTLAVSNTGKRHTAENLGGFLTDVIKAHGIEEKVCFHSILLCTIELIYGFGQVAEGFITTDSAANLAAIRDYTKCKGRMACAAHPLQLSAKAALQVF